jgi:cytochrome c556
MRSAAAPRGRGIEDGLPDEERRMQRKSFATASIALVAVMVGFAVAQEKPKTIKEVMANHKGGQLRSQIDTGLKAAEPNWTDLQAKTKTYAAAAAEPGNFTPPKGEAAAYKEVAKSFSDAVKQLDDAAQKKDAAAAKTAFAASGALCGKCHTAHRG